MQISAPIPLADLVSQSGTYSNMATDATQSSTFADLLQSSQHLEETQSKTETDNNTGSSNSSPPQEPAQQSIQILQWLGQTGAEVSLSKTTSSDIQKTAVSSCKADLVPTESIKHHKMSTLVAPLCPPATMDWSFPEGPGVWHIQTASVQLTTDSASQLLANNSNTWEPFALTTTGHRTHATAQIDPVKTHIHVPIQSSNWDQALAQRVQWMVQDQVSSATLSIHPPHLGPVQIQMQVENHIVQIQFISKAEEVRQAIQNAMPALHHMLEQSGLQLSHSDVSDHRTARHNFYKSDRRTQNIHPLPESEESITRLWSSSGSGILNTYA